MKSWISATPLLLVLTTSLADAETAATGYGRVFFTPQDRVLLDGARRNKIRTVAKTTAPRPAPIAAAAPSKPERPSGNVTLNGIVRRSDGESTIWVNGVAMPADAQTGKVQVAPSTSQSGVIRIPNTSDAGPVELKVGQKLDLSSGNVTERYVNRDAPRVTPAARPSATTPAPRVTRRPARDELETPESQ